MRIAIQTADLDAPRVDGTRVYLWQLLRRFGSLAPDDAFTLYHRTSFNPHITPPDFSNYYVRSLPQPLLWTQTRLAFSLYQDKPNALWMPVQSMPFFKNPKMISTVTIHDLAFRYFPQHFPLRDRYKLFLLASLAIHRAHKIIAVSRHTKKDILHFYPDIDPEKITVVHHGYDSSMFSAKEEKDVRKKEKCLQSFGIGKSRYLLYVGALQPRKNIEMLIGAFNVLKKKESFSDIKLVLAGERAWLWESIERKRNQSPYREDIIMTGKLPFCDIVTLYKNASLFVYPSLYEGFGLPVLEGFGAGVPVVCSRVSSLPEVGGDGAVYFDPYSESDLVASLEKLLSDEVLCQWYIERGREQLKHFSWDKCAKKTLDVIRKDV